MENFINTKERDMINARRQAIIAHNREWVKEMSRINTPGLEKAVYALGTRKDDHAVFKNLRNSDDPEHEPYILAIPLGHRFLKEQVLGMLRSIIAETGEQIWVISYSSEETS